MSRELPDCPDRFAIVGHCHDAGRKRGELIHGRVTLFSEWVDGETELQAAFFQGGRA